MRKVIAGLALCLLVVALDGAEAPYYPLPGQWAHKAPVEVGMDAAKLKDAVEFMKAHETLSPARDFPTRKPSTANSSPRSRQSAQPPRCPVEGSCSAMS